MMIYVLMSWDSPDAHGIDSIHLTDEAARAVVSSRFAAHGSPWTEGDEFTIISKNPSPYGTNERYTIESFELIQPGWEGVCSWVAEDYECHAALIEVTSQGPNYNDNDEIEDLGISYTVKLSETANYGPPPPLNDSLRDTSYSIAEHVGFGDTLDEASINALAMRAMFWAEVESTQLS
jgi:hypothetical protein